MKIIFDSNSLHAFKSHTFRLLCYISRIPEAGDNFSPGTHNSFFMGVGDVVKFFSNPGCIMLYSPKPQKSQHTSLHRKLTGDEWGTGKGRHSNSPTPRELPTPAIYPLAMCIFASNAINYHSFETVNCILVEFQETLPYSRGFEFH